MQHDHSVTAILNALFSTAAERVQAAIAVGAVVSPLWRRYLHDVSEDAAQLAPILGCLWLTVQISTKLYAEFRRWRPRA